MPSISVTIAPGLDKSQYLNLCTEVGNTLPLKKHYPASPEPSPCYWIGVRNLSKYIMIVLGFVYAQLGLKAKGP